MKSCYYHLEREATYTDSGVDLWLSTDFATTYKRVPICQTCVIERKSVNTSRVEPIDKPVPATPAGTEPEKEQP